MTFEWKEHLDSRRPERPGRSPHDYRQVHHEDRPATHGLLGATQNNFGLTVETHVASTVRAIGK